MSFRKLPVFLFTLLYLASIDASNNVMLAANQAKEKWQDTPNQLSLYTDWGGIYIYKACADKIKLNLSISGRAKQQTREENLSKLKRFNDNMPRFMEKAMASCPDIKSVHGRLNVMYKDNTNRYTGTGGKEFLFKANKENDWKLEYEEITNVKALMDNRQTGIDFYDREGRQRDGRININGTQMKAIYGVELANRMDLKVYAIEGIDDYLVSGYWYELGEHEKTCHIKKNGYRYWGRVHTLLSSFKGQFYKEPCYGDNDAKAPARAAFGGYTDKQFKQPEHDGSKLVARLKSLLSKQKLPEIKPTDHRFKDLYFHVENRIMHSKVSRADWCQKEGHFDAYFQYELEKRASKPGGFVQYIAKQLTKRCKKMQTVNVKMYYPGWDLPIDTVKADVRDYTVKYNQQAAWGTRKIPILSHDYKKDLIVKLGYQNNCLGCHDYGAGGAPKPGDLKGESLTLVDQAMNQNQFHFGNMHCRRCTNKQLIQIVDYMKKAKPENRPVESLDPLNRARNRYANNATAENLMRSGLLLWGSLVNEIYHGTDTASRADLDALFFNTVMIANARCGGGSASYVHEDYQMVDFQSDAEGDTQVWGNVTLATTRMKPEYLPHYRELAPDYLAFASFYDDFRYIGPRRFKQMKVGGGLIGNIHRTKIDRLIKDTDIPRAIYGFADSCTDPAPAQFLKNLHLFASEGKRLSDKETPYTFLVEENRKSNGLTN